MKRLTLALALGLSAIVACVAVEPAHSQNAYPSLAFKTVEVPFRFLRASSYSGTGVILNNSSGAIVDSSGTGVVLGANPVNTDTTAWVSLDDMVWSYPGVAPTTAFSPIRITVSGTNTSEDSLGIVTDVQFDGSNTFSTTTPANVLSTGAGTFDNLLTGSIATDADAAIAATQIPYGAKRLRFRLTGTGTAAGAGVMTAVRIYVTYPTAAKQP